MSQNVSNATSVFIPTAGKRPSWRGWSRYLYPAPLLAILAVLIVFPILYSIRISFYHYYLTQGRMTFAGLDNYAEALSDKAFFGSIGLNLHIILVSLVFEFMLGLSLALAANSIRVGRALIVACLTTPIMISTAATGMAFKMIMLPEYGPLNYIIGWFTGEGWVLIDWLGDQDWAVWSIIVANVWKSTPFVMLILLAGLASISQELYEAGRIDGASSFQLFRYITLPLLKNSIIVAFLLRVIDLVKLFDLVLLLTQGGPARATETMSLYVYFVGLRFFRIGYGVTLALFLLLICLILTVLLLRVLKGSEVQA